MPVMNPATEESLPQVEPAEYIVCWRRCLPPRGFAVVWESADGVLLRRTP